MAFRIGRRQNDSGYDKNVGKDFRSFIMKTSAGYGKRSSIKMPHDESPDHPRYINGVPYIVPLQRQEPYHEINMSRESDISSLESRLGRRGSLTQRFAMQNEDKEKGWNRDVHPTRIHYYPDKGPMSPKKIQISREKRKETLRMLPTSTAGVARIATDASRERLLNDRVMAWEEQHFLEELEYKAGIDRAVPIPEATVVRETPKKEGDVEISPASPEELADEYVRRANATRQSNKQVESPRSSILKEAKDAIRRLKQMKGEMLMEGHGDEEESAVEQRGAMMTGDHMDSLVFRRLKSHIFENHAVHDHVKLVRTRETSVGVDTFVVFGTSVFIEFLCIINFECSVKELNQLVQGLKCSNQPSPAEEVRLDSKLFRSPSKVPLPKSSK
jgi:hypothetical protein